MHTFSLYLLCVASVLLHCIDTIVGNAIRRTAGSAQPKNLTGAGTIHMILAVNCQDVCIILFFLAAPMLRMCLMRQPGAMERTVVSAEPWNLT